MSRILTPICLATILLSGCTPLTTAAVEVAHPAQPTATLATLPDDAGVAPADSAAEASAQPTAVPVAAAEAVTPGDCPVTQPILDQPPDDPNADPFGFGYWYVNEDRTMWAPGHGSWRAGGEKVAWIRPQGTDLTVTGDRLDGEAPPLRADIPCCYSTGFQITGLTFPTEGCWEVTAQAGDSELRFVTQVGPAAHPVAGGACESLVDVVGQSDAIVVGLITDVESDGRHAWQSVSVLETWKLPQGWNGIGDRFSLLQDLEAEPGLEKDRQYVLFLQYQPWQLVCASRSVVEKQGEQAIPLGDSPLWPGGAIAGLKTEVSKLLASPTETLSLSPAPLTKDAMAACPVSLPNVTTSPNEHFVSTISGYQNSDGTMFTLLWPGGKVIFSPAGPGRKNPDGSLGMKWPWYRTIPGDVIIEGHRLDAPAPPMHPILLRGVPDGYGETGFHPSGLLFTSAGCWEVTAKVGQASLTFVTLVVKIPFEPD